MNSVLFQQTAFATSTLAGLRKIACEGGKPASDAEQTRIKGCIVTMREELDAMEAALGGNVCPVADPKRQAFAKLLAFLHEAPAQRFRLSNMVEAVKHLHLSEVIFPDEGCEMSVSEELISLGALCGRLVNQKMDNGLCLKKHRKTNGIEYYVRDLNAVETEEEKKGGKAA